MAAHRYFGPPFHQRRASPTEGRKPEKVGTLETVVGNATIVGFASSGEVTRTKAKAGMELTDADTVETAADGSVVVLLTTGRRVFVMSDSSCFIM